VILSNAKIQAEVGEIFAGTRPTPVSETAVFKRVFEKFYLGASRLSMRRMAARSMKASEVWTFNS